MEREQFSRRAQNLIRKATVLGIDPEAIKAEARQALEIAKSNGKPVVTREELKALETRVGDTIVFNRLVNQK